MKTWIKSAVGVAFCLPVVETVAANASPSSVPELFTPTYVMQVLGSLLLVVLCLFAVILLLRRFNRIGSVTGIPLKVLASASVGQRERVVLVEAGEEQLLLGVAPGSVRMLHRLPEPVVSDAAANTPDFANVLRAANPLGSRS